MQYGQWKLAQEEHLREVGEGREAKTEGSGSAWIDVVAAVGSKQSGFRIPETAKRETMDEK